MSSPHGAQAGRRAAHCSAHVDDAALRPQIALVGCSAAGDQQGCRVRLDPGAPQQPRGTAYDTRRRVVAARPHRSRSRRDRAQQDRSTRQWAGRDRGLAVLRGQRGRDGAREEHSEGSGQRQLTPLLVGDHQRSCHVVVPGRRPDRAEAGRPWIDHCGCGGHDQRVRAQRAQQPAGTPAADAAASRDQVADRVDPPPLLVVPAGPARPSRHPSRHPFSRPQLRRRDKPVATACGEGPRPKPRLRRRASAGVRQTRDPGGVAEGGGPTAFELLDPLGAGDQQLAARYG